MNILKLLSFLTLISIVISCEQAEEFSQPNLVETESIIINDVAYAYNYTTDPNTGETTGITGGNATLIQEFFDQNEEYGKWVNLDNNEVRYYSDFKAMDRAIQTSMTTDSNNNEFTDDQDAGGTPGGEEGGTGEGGSTGGGSTGGGSAGGGSTGGGTTFAFDQCPNVPMVQLAEHSNGNGVRVDMYHTFQGGVAVDFLSFPTFSGTVNFNDILSSFKICRSTANWVEFQIFEHAGFAGSREVWTVNTQSEAIASDLNNYVRNIGFLGIGRTDWNDVVSSAKFIIH